MELNLNLDLDEILPFWREESSLLERYVDHFKEIPAHQRHEEKYYWLGMMFLTGKDPENRPVIQSEKVALQYLYQASDIGHQESIRFLEKIDTVVRLVITLNELESEVELYESEITLWNSNEHYSDNKSYYLEYYQDLLIPLSHQISDLKGDIDYSKEQLQAEFLLTPSEVSGLINNYIKGVQEC